MIYSTNRLPEPVAAETITINTGSMRIEIGQVGGSIRIRNLSGKDVTLHKQNGSVHIEPVEDNGDDQD